MRRMLCPLLFIILISFPVFAAIPASERAALIALYNCTNGDGWIIKSGWKTPPLDPTDHFALPGTENTWYGVKAPSAHVTEVHFESNNLVGYLPSDLGALPYVTEMVFQGNPNLTGSIPAEISNISVLQVLRLGLNDLTGELPSAIFSIPSLVTFEVNSNRLSGPIPSQIGNMTRGGEIQLESNAFSGEIPSTVTSVIASEFIISNNMLTSTNTTVRTWLDAHSANWEATQTVPPANVTVTPLTTSSVRVAWSPVAYTGDGGYYEIGHRTAPGGYTSFNVTDNKSVSSLEITGLDPGTTYYFAVRSYTPAHGVQPNDLLSDYSEEVPGETVSLLPAAVTQAAGSIAKSSVTLLGLVNAKGLPTAVTFQWGTTTAYGSQMAAYNSPANGTSLESIYANLTGLTPGATYHYRIVAVNSAGTRYGEDISFTTPLVDYFWLNTNNGVLSGDIRALAVNAQNDIFAGTESKGIYRSTDGGKSWSAINNGMPAKSVCGIAFNASGHIFIATNPGGVFRSTTNGNSWELVNGTTLKTQRIMCIAIDAEGRIFAGCEDEWGIFRSQDNGESWTHCEGATAKLNIMTIAIDDHGALFAGTRDHGVYYSSDHGANWSQKSRGLDLSDPCDVLSFTFGPTGEIYTNIWNLGVFKSVDQGGNWQRVSTIPHASEVRQMLQVGQDHLYAITWCSRTVYRSFDAGANWEPLDAGLESLSDGRARCLTLDKDGYLYLGTYSGGLFKSTQVVTIPPPILTVLEASTIDYDAATLNGEVNARGVPVEISFEYGTDTGYGHSVSAVPSSLSGTAPVSVSAALSGLSVNTTYHYRLVVTMNDLSHVYSADKSFTTAVFSQKERRALIALYQSTNGDAWNCKAGWKEGELADDGFAKTGTEWRWCGVDTSDGHVVRIVLNHNNLKGVLPKEIGDLLYINKFIIIGNYVTGEVPAELGRCVNMVELWLSHNQLSGTLAPELQNLKKLHYFCIDYNDFSGQIPSWIGTIPELASLEWQGNRFSGSIPAELFDLPLGKLHLSYNQLSGEIPPSILAIKNTINSTELDFQFNKLECNDQEVRNFLYTYSRNWDKTQTLPPGNIKSIKLSPSSVQLSWTPITFQDSAGYYIIYRGPASGVYTDSVTTTNKADSTYIFADLNQDTYFSIRTFTDAHGPYATSPYPVRRYQQNSLLSKTSEEVLFKTSSVKPGIWTHSVYQKTDSTATLTGTVNPNGNTLTVRFQYGRTAAYGDSTEADQSPVSGSSPVAVSKTITGLLPNTTYHYRVVAVNAAYREFGADSTFTTPSAVEQNLPPVLSVIEDVSIAEDSTAGPISFRVEDGDDEETALEVSVLSSNQALVPDSRIVLGGSGASRTITVMPLPDSSGIATITVTVKDPANVPATEEFLLTVVPINDPPQLSEIADCTTARNTAKKIAFTVSDIDNALADLSISASSGNSTLLPQGNIGYSGTGGSREITLTPAANQTGTTTVTVTVSDGSGDPVEDSFLFTVADDLEPVLSAIGDVTIAEDSTAGPISFTVEDGDDEETALEVSALSSNQALVPDSSIVVGGSGASRTITVTPLPDVYGTATITVTVKDPANVAAVEEFLLTVVPVNDPPQLSKIADCATSRNGAKTIGFMISDIDNALAGLSVSALSGNTTLLPQGNISFSGTEGSREITLTPAANQTGTTTVTVTVSDGSGGLAQDSFLFAVADDLAPNLSSMEDVTINEDSTAGPISFTVEDGDDEETALEVSALSSNQALVPDSSIVLGGSGASRTITVTPLPDVYGTATITVTVKDPANVAAVEEFLLTVEPVNDPPRIADLPDQMVQANHALILDPVTISDIDNSVQTLNLSGSSSDTNLVATSNYTITGNAATRAVTITPKRNQSGKVTITLTVTDPEGASASDSFILTVTAQPGIDLVAPQIVHSAITTANAGVAIPVNAIITDNKGVLAAQLFYRLGGAIDFNALSMNTSGGNFSAVIPAEAVTGRGIEYYLLAVDSASNGSTAPENPAPPFIVQVRTSDLAFPTATPAMAYRMISVPGILDSPAISSVLEDDLSGYDDTAWRLLHYENGVFAEYGSSGFPVFNPGRSYWLITRTPAVVDVGSAKSVNTAQSFEITLSPGWNQIGNPFLFPVDWSQIKKPAQVENKLVGYYGAKNEPGGYDHFRSELAPWEGYFVNNLGSTPAIIQIPARSNSSALAKTAEEVFQRSFATDEWYVQISAQCGEFIDRHNFFGCRGDAETEWDANDFSEPPACSGSLSLSFPHPEWNRYPGLFSGDFRPAAAVEPIWEFLVTTSEAGRVVTLGLEQIHNLPPDRHITLTDLGSGRSFDLGAVRSYQYLTETGKSIRRFRAEVRANTAIPSQAVPAEYRLLPNYPNPFNNSTIFTCEIPEASRVYVTLFDVNGQFVTELCGQHRERGIHQFVWDGRDEKGQSLASGVYLVRLTAGQFAATQRIVLMK